MDVITPTRYLPNMFIWNLKNEERLLSSLFTTIYPKPLLEKYLASMKIYVDRGCSPFIESIILPNILMQQLKGFDRYINIVRMGLKCLKLNLKITKYD